MKKIVIVLGTALCLWSCKKNGELDITKLPDAVNTVNDAAKKNLKDLDSANFKIKDWEAAQAKTNEVINETAKLADSIQKTVDKIDLAAQSKKVDSALKVATPKEAAQQVIKETKIIYKEAPSKEIPLVTKGDAIIKIGTLRAVTSNFEDSKSIINDIIYNREGKIDHESVNYKGNDIFADYVIKIPTQQFDYAFKDFENSFQHIQVKQTDVKGKRYIDNSTSVIYLSLVPATSVENEENKNSLTDAFAEGWEGLLSFIYFILPLWPFLLIVGIMFYFYKRKNKIKKSDNQNENLE